MPYWEPKPIWEGAEVFIIGGGPSLLDFDWSLLKDEKTIGCNMAFRLGEEICDVCVFGDASWYKHFKQDLSQFTNPVFTNATAVIDKDRGSLAWINFMEREPFGLHKNALGWNGHTGSVAINLAMLFGASTIYLLGFDMHRTPDRSNWHDEVIHKDAVLSGSYELFRRKSDKMIAGWKENFPNVRIINLCKDSSLEGIPKRDIDGFFSQRKQRIA